MATNTNKKTTTKKTAAKKKPEEEKSAADAKAAEENAAANAASTDANTNADGDEKDAPDASTEKPTAKASPAAVPPGTVAFMSTVANMKVKGVQFSKGYYATSDQNEIETIESSGQFGKSIFRA